MELVFVYNANGGKWNGWLDSMHKIFSPRTYPCSLCAITYGTFVIEPEWENFLKTLPSAPVFLHKDEFETLYPGNKTKLPVVFKRENNVLNIVIQATELNEINLQQLISKIDSFYKL